MVVLKSVATVRNTEPSDKTIRFNVHWITLEFTHTQRDTQTHTHT